MLTQNYKIHDSLVTLFNEENIPLKLNHKSVSKNIIYDLIPLPLHVSTLKYGSDVHLILIEID